MGRAVTLALFGHTTKIVEDLNTLFPNVKGPVEVCVRGGRGWGDSPACQPLHPESQEELG